MDPTGTRITQTSERLSGNARRVLSDGAYTFGLRLANIVVSVGLGILTARLLGPGGKGLFALPFVQAGLISTGFAGLSSATSYYLLNHERGRQVLTPALRTTGVFVGIAAVIVTIVALIAHTPWAILPAIASLPGVAIANVVTGYVIGIKRVRLATTLNAATTILTFAMMAAGLFLVSRSASMAILVWIVSVFVVSAVGLIAVLVHARSLPAGQPVPLPPYLAMASKVGVTSIVSMLNYRADVYVVAIFLPAASLGLYSVAVAAAESLLVPTQVAALVTSPHIGSLEPTAAAKLAARCVRNNLLVALLVCATLFVVAPWVVRLFYGAPFLPLIPSLRILLIGVLALSLGSPVSTYYTLKLGRPGIPLALAGASAVLCIVMAVILVPRVGITGAATASTVAYVVGQGAGLAYFARQTGVGITTMLVPRMADIALYYHYARTFGRPNASLG